MDEHYITTIATDMIRTLVLPTKTAPHPVAVLLVGPPLSGKSTLVEAITKELPIVPLSWDGMTAFFAPSQSFFQKDSPEVFTLVSRVIGMLVEKGISCVLDVSMKKASHREAIRNVVEAKGGKVIVITCSLSKEEAQEQMKKANAHITAGEKRGFIMDQSLMNYELNTIEWPHSDERFLAYSFADPFAKDKVIHFLHTLLDQV